MKKILYTLLIALVAVSCATEMDQTYEYDGETIHIDLGIATPSDDEPITKSFAVDPTINNLYAAVFDESGYLTEYKECTCEAVTANGSSNAKSWSVDLKVAKKKARTIHFIANGPSEVAFGSEEEVVAAMKTYANPSDGQIGPDAYWQRVELPSGICYEPGTESTTKELIADSKTRLSSVGLVRNFAMLTIKSSATNFEMTEALVVGVPDCGYVAPYNRTSSKFQSDLPTLSAEALVSDGYTGSVPPTATYSTDASTATVFTADADGVVTAFMYEREKPTSNPTYVILGGYYNGGTEKTYYKVNLEDTDGKKFAIFRNFNYSVDLASVNAPGSSSIDEASQTSGTGDLSTNVSYKNIIAISNGESQIAVEYTEKVVIDSDPFTLNFKYIPDQTETYTSGTHSGEAVVNNTSEYTGSNNTALDLTEVGSKVQVYIGAAGSLGAAISSVSIADSDNDDLSRTITITPTTPTSVPKSQDIVIVGHRLTEDANGVKTLTTITRSVTIIVRGRYTMSLSCDPTEVEETIGSAVTLNITLPQGLPSAVFPLHLAIEAENLSLSPAEGDVTLVTGKSIIPGSTKTSTFHFVKTVNYSEYYNGSAYTNVISVNFKTSSEISATNIYVTNDYFNTASTAITNKGIEVDAKFGTTTGLQRWYTGISDADGYAAQNNESTLSARVSTTKYAATTVTFTIGDDVVTATSDGTKDSDGYYIYTAAYTPTTGGNKTVTLTAKCGTTTATATDTMVVYYQTKTKTGTETKLGNALTEAKFDTSTNYVLYNSSSSKYLYCTSDGFSTASSDDCTNDYYLFRFGSTSSTSTIKNVGTSKYISITSNNSGNGGNKPGNNNVSLSLASTGTSLTISYSNSNSGFAISYTSSGNNGSMGGGPGGNETYYLTINNSNVSVQRNNASYWQIYPVVTEDVYEITYVKP